MKTKAAVLYKIKEPLIVEDIGIPDLVDGQVLVKMLCTGICHTQINEISGLKGEDKYLPHLLGHEGSGIVHSVGVGVTKVRPGDYVVLTWIKGLGKDISSSQYLNGKIKINSGAITTFNEYSVVSENRVVKISDDIPPEIATLLGCAVPTGAGIIKNEIMLNQSNSLAIFGIGGVGSSALLYASYLKCSNIICVDVVESKLEFACKLGATHIINALKEDVVRMIKKLTGGLGVDYSVECSGVKKAMEWAFECTKDSGTTVLAGNLKYGEKISLDPFEMIRGKRIIGTWGGKTYPEIDIPHYGQLYLNGSLKLKKLISGVYTLEKINDAISMFNKGTAIRILIDFKKAIK